jgi:hypothetical protein
MRITDIGEVREDGSILLYDENIKGRKDLPRRIRPSAVQKQVLAENGLQWVLSSFISAIGEDENDLIIRFWNGSLYRYFGFKHQYEPMLGAPSKGKYFWKHIRSTKRYERMGSLPLTKDLAMNDTELFQKMADTYNQVVMEMARKGITEVIFDDQSGREFLKISYNGEVIYLLITKKPG